MFRAVSPPIIRSTYNCIYSIWYLSKRWNCRAVPTLPRQRQVAVTVWQVPDAVYTVVCVPDDGWRYRPKHVEQLPEINIRCNVVSCWICIRIYLRYTDPWTSKKIGLCSVFYVLCWCKTSRSLILHSKSPTARPNVWINSQTKKVEASPTWKQKYYGSGARLLN